MEGARQVNVPRVWDGIRSTLGNWGEGSMRIMKVSTYLCLDTYFMNFFGDDLWITSALDSTLAPQAMPCTWVSFRKRKTKDRSAPATPGIPPPT